jgi:hypothetical protein
MTRRILRVITLALLVYILAQASVHSQALAPSDYTEAEKLEYLKLGYLLNGNSMVRWGSIDLTAPLPATPDEIMGQAAVRVIPIEPEKRKDKRK